MCMDANKKCDSILDCKDGSDELECSTTPSIIHFIFWFNLILNLIIIKFKADSTTTIITPSIVISITPDQESIEIREKSSLLIKCSATGRYPDLQTVIYKDQVEIK